MLIHDSEVVHRHFSTLIRGLLIQLTHFIHLPLQRPGQIRPAPTKTLHLSLHPHVLLICLVEELLRPRRQGLPAHGAHVLSRCRLSQALHALLAVPVTARRQTDGVTHGVEADGTVVVLAEAEGSPRRIGSCGDPARRRLLILLLLCRCCSPRRCRRGLAGILRRCLRQVLLSVVHGLVRGLLHRVLPLARGLAGVLVSAPPVLLLAGLGAIGHDLAAGAVAEGLALLRHLAAEPAGPRRASLLPVHRLPRFQAGSSANRPTLFFPFFFWPPFR